MASTLTKEIATTWDNGHGSCHLIIPKRFAEKYDMAAGSKVIVEDTGSGLLLKKLEWS